ncbi:MAG TPA: hypothetical protein DHV17_03200, partial [Chitinophagaceae bacterium]|nr:hypothetical protein [Chitinophagaceae bacterium]
MRKSDTLHFTPHVFHQQPAAVDATFVYSSLPILQNKHHMQTFTSNKTSKWSAGYQWFLSAITGLLFLFAGTVNGQVTVTNPGNTTPGLSATYTDLASAITALNAQTAISGPVTISLAGGNPQTAPSGGYAITAILSGASSSNTVTIDGGGNTITMPSPAGASGALNDAIFKFIGADFMTLQNFTMQENAANTTTTAGSNNMTEWGVALLYASTTNGAQNITIQNNTISLNRTYQNTFGIYSNSTHTATNVSTSAPATSTDGNNSGLKIYSNNISNVNNGIVIVGPTTAANYNTGIDIGGTGPGTANTLTNYGTTGTFSSYANVSGTTNGILVRNSVGFNISYNSITSSNGGVTVGVLHGIHIPAASVAATGTFTNEVSNNSISLKSGLSSGGMIGINFLTNHATATSTTNINNNNFFDFDHTTGTASGTITFITTTGVDQTKNITGNTFTNMSVKTTGTVNFISHSYTMQSGYSCTVSNNSVVTGFTKTGAGGTVVFATTGASSVNGSTAIYSNNNFSNISVTGATTLTGINTTDGLSTGSSAKTISGNTFSNWTGGTSTVSGMIVSYFGSGNSSINNNTISNISGGGTVNGLTINASGNLGTQVDIHTNTFSGISSSGGTVTGIGCNNSSPDINIYNNSISNLSTSSNFLVAGIIVGTGATNTDVYANTICGLSGTAPGSTIDGIRVTATTANGVVSVYNNRIGDLTTPDAVGANVINGIDITTTTATVSVNVYFNTVYLNASSTGVDFGTSALTANTGPNVTMINNALINNSSANGTGLTVAYRRSSATLTSYNAASNNNVLYAGTPSASNLIFFDGTNSDQTMNDFKLRVAPRDGNSNAENPPFLSTACGNSNFLKVNTAIATLMESTGTPVSGITVDFEGDSRNGSTPDVGADEFAGTAAAVVAINSVSINPTATILCTAAARTITANISVGGTNLVSAQVFYTINGVLQAPINMTGGNPNAGQTSDWTAVIPVPSPANASISWSVAAADAVTSKVETGTTYQDEPLLGASGVATASAPSVCAGAEVTLSGTLIAGGSVVPVGAGSTTDASYLAPFYSAWSNKHEQILIRADELTAAGLYPGAITEISFPTTSGTISPLDFTVKLGHTTQTDMTSFVTSGLTQVYFAASQAQVANTNNT